MPRPSRFYKRALAIREKALGPDHPDVATVAQQPRRALPCAQGRYAEAEPLYKRALAILRRQLGPDHPDVATTLNNLAELYRHQGRYAEAEPLYKRALAIREKALGPDHPDVATSLNNLAVLHHTQGRFAEAEPLYKRSLAIREKALGPDHVNVGQSLNNLGELYRMQGRSARGRAPLQAVPVDLRKSRRAPTIPRSPSRSATSPSCIMRKADTAKPRHSTNARSPSPRWRSDATTLISP